MKIKYSATVRPHPRASGEVSLFLRLNISGKRREISLGTAIKEGQWDDKAKRVRNRPDAGELNYHISEALTTLQSIMARYEMVEQRAPTCDEVAGELNRRYGRETEQKPEDTTVAEAIGMFVSDQAAANGWTRSTESKFHAMRSHMEQWRPGVRLRDMDDDATAAYMRFLTDTLGHRNTTLQKDASFLRWFLRWCVSKGMYKGTSHDTFRPRYKGGSGEYKDIIYLEAGELRALEEYEFPDPSSHLARLRDVFVFACYCGLRYSDVAQLRRENIVGDSICVVTRKTSDRLSIPLNSHTRAILELWSGWKDSRGRLLPVISNQKSNEGLKELCRLAGIDTPVEVVYYKGARRYEEVHPKYELVSFHCGRHTFITQALRLGIPSEVIMKFSGHHSHAMLKPYMKVVDELKEREMSKFDNM